MKPTLESNRKFQRNKMAWIRTTNALAKTVACPVCHAGRSKQCILSKPVLTRKSKRVRKATIGPHHERLALARSVS